jgi:hypothetical protein
MTLVLQRLLLSASVLICLVVPAADAQLSQPSSPRDVTPPKQPTTTTVPPSVSPARQGQGQTPIPTTLSRPGTPPPSSTVPTVSPAKLGQTPTTPGPGTASTTRRTTPTTVPTTLSQLAPVRSTPLNVEVSSTVPTIPPGLRTTPTKSPSSPPVSRRDTPPTSAKSSLTSFISQPFSTPTPLVPSAPLPTGFRRPARRNLRRRNPTQGDQGKQ